MIQIVEDTAEKIGCTDACVFLLMLRYQRDIAYKDVDLELRLEAYGRYIQWLKTREIEDDVEEFTLGILTGRLIMVEEDD